MASSTAKRSGSKNIRADSKRLADWIYWMALDILETGNWRIEYADVSSDTIRRDFISRKRRRAPKRLNSQRCYREDAYVLHDEEKIVIDRSAKDKALCLFHECLEVLFDDWTDNYFVPARWGLESRSDPILHLEAVTWDRLSEFQKNAIKSYLPKGP